MADTGWKGWLTGARGRMVWTTSLFVLVVITGGVWVGAARRLTGADDASYPIAIMGAVFAAVYVLFLIERLRRLLDDSDVFWRELVLLAINLTIIVLAFAWVHSRIGIMDASGPVERPTRDFGSSLYFSIVTMTTVGYGEFYPIGVGRAVAAIQSVVGFFSFGILVSTGFKLLAPHSPARISEGSQ